MTAFSRLQSYALPVIGVLTILELFLIWNTNIEHSKHQISLREDRKAEYKTASIRRSPSSARPKSFAEVVQEGYAAKPFKFPESDPKILEKSIEEPGEAEQPAIEKEPNRPSFHYVFSTGCSAFQDWQSYSLFYFARELVNDPTRDVSVTRVASGCDKVSGPVLEQVFIDQIHPLSTKFKLHLTPEYSYMIPKLRYKFFNKPFGLRHWMKNNLRMHENKEHDDTIFIILDPDQIVLRPFDINLTRDRDSIVWRVKPPEDKPLLIEHGQPFGQFYAMGARWVPKVKANLSHVLEALGDEAEISHLHEFTAEEVENHYVAGPPYIGTGRDMFKIVSTWAQIAVPIYDLTTGHLSEMFAYCAAAAHHNLKHHLGYGFMISNPDVGKQEGWRWMNAVPGPEVCESAYSGNFTAVVDKAEDQNLYIPNVLHFCQRYFLGPYFFSKYILPKNFLSCDHPLLSEPQPEFTTKHTTSITPNGDLNKIKPDKINRHAFMLCHLLVRMNEVATYWKQNHCEIGKANYEKTFFFRKK